MKPSFRYQEEDDDISPGIGTPISYSSTPTSFAYVEEAIPLITQTSGFRINEDAIEFLRSLKPPIAVVGVAGLYRTGKSYLLNRVLLNRKSGFGVGPTVNPCTKGLWIWGTPIEGTTADGRQCSVVLMDSEGIGALDEDADHDTRIFSLTILLSSFFLYNSIGALDESALENLSLVVNLTKHIHIKSQQGQEVDSQDYSQYFPAFLWIVRDFSLQLVDSDGQSLTPKQYLQKVLQPQKGFSDSIEQKNRIRRLLKDFFQERDCFTMVRPLTHQGDLQNLGSFQLEELRPQFRKQVLQLRKTVFGRLRPKALNGKEMSGDMLANLFQNYISAINRGAVPNIENTWNYVCKTQCSNAVDHGKDLYDKVLLSSINQRFPINQEDLKLFHKEAKQTAIQAFRKRAAGNQVDKYLKKLKEIITDKYLDLADQNVMEGQKKIYAFMNQNYSSIDNKIKRGDFNGFYEYEKDMRTFQSFVIDHGPDGPYRKEQILQFIQSKLSSAADYFVKAMNNQLQIQVQMKQDQISRLQNELRQSKQDFLAQRDNLQRKLTTSESDRAELTAKQLGLREQMQNLVKQRQQIEFKLRQDAKSARTESLLEIERAHSSVEQHQEKMKELNRELMQKQNQFKQQLALLEQKNKYLETSLQDSKRREKQALNESKSQKRDHTSTLNQLKQRYENQIKSLQHRLEGQNEKIAELQRDLEQKQVKYDSESSHWEQKDLKFTSIIQDLKLQVSSLTEKLARKQTDYKKKIAQLTRTNQQSLNSLRNKMTDLQTRLKAKQDQLKTTQVESAKQNAILTQKVQFAQQDLYQTKQQLEQERRQHQTMLRTLNAGSGGATRQEVEQQLEKFKNKYVQDIKSMELEHENVRRRLNDQMQEYFKENAQLELQLKMLDSQQGSKLTSLEEENLSLKFQREQLQSEVTTLQLKLESSAVEIEMKLKKRITALQNQLEETRNKLNQEIVNANQRAEQSYTQLKSFYQQEKMRLESRLTEDKQRADKKYSAMCEQYQDRIRMESENFEQELAAKEDQMRDIEAFFNEEMANLKHQQALDTQKIETLQKYLREMKEQQETAQKAHAAALEQQQERMNAQRAGLVQKVQKLANDIANKDREYTSLTYKYEQLEGQFRSKEAQLEDLNASSARTKQVLSERLESSKQAYQKINDEFTQKQSDFKREMALAQQEIQFKTRKIDDIQRALQDAEERYNQTVRSLKDESGQELSQTIAKLTQDKETLTLRLDEKRKAYKQLTTSSSKQITGLQKQKAVLSQKLNNLQAKKSDLEIRFKAQIQNLQQQLKEKQNSKTTDQMAIQLQNQRLKIQLQQNQKQGAEREAAYQRQRMLWDNKCNFLVQQRDQAKTDLAQTQKKFEATLEQIQRKGISDKANFEQTTNQLVASVQARYVNQIRDLQQTNTSNISQSTEKINALENSLRQTREELELEKRGNLANSGTLEKRLQELTDSQARLNTQVATMKQTYQKRLLDSTETLEAEKLQLKHKMADIERKAKQAQNARSILFIEHQKERAKWNYEKDHLTNQRMETQDALDRSERKREALLRENERLKSQKGTRGQGAALFTRRQEMNNQQFRQVATGLLGQSTGITFEEFQKDKHSQGHETPSSGTPDASPRPPRKHRPGK